MVVNQILAPDGTTVTPGPIINLTLILTYLTGWTKILSASIILQQILELMNTKSMVPVLTINLLLLPTPPGKTNTLPEFKMLMVILILWRLLTVLELLLVILKLIVSILWKVLYKMGLGLLELNLNLVVKKLTVFKIWKLLICAWTFFLNLLHVIVLLVIVLYVLVMNLFWYLYTKLLHLL